MSFSDMMSTGRGPGVIGMVMALVVVLGFGLLFMFAFDEGMQGDDRSIEAVIRDQDKEIKEYEARMDSGRKSLDLAPGRITGAKDLTRLKAESVSLQEKITGLIQSVEAGKTAFAETRESFEGYKEQYRAFVRGKAKGTTMEQLETTGGVIYKAVNIRDVTAVGIQIIHEGGQKRVPFEELPAEMKDYYQFDADKKQAALDQERIEREKHEKAVAVHGEEADKQKALDDAKKVAQARVRAQQQIDLKSSQIRNLTVQLHDLRDDLDRERMKRGVANTDAIKQKITAAERSISALQSEVQKLQSQL
ncbi:MAG: hypothetical protein EOP88_10500 [Verrucomicrobiaceae bacterium]|nr:MAG: hypothetical protein EOP88_10500 [Verrucomicrobiaceae bacterium]